MGVFLSTKVRIKPLLLFNSFICHTSFKAKVSLSTELKHFCNLLIGVTAFHIVLCTFRESYCNAITLSALTCTEVCEDNWVLRFEAHISSLEFYIM